MNWGQRGPFSGPVRWDMWSVLTGYTTDVENYGFRVSSRHSGVEDENPWILPSLPPTRRPLLRLDRVWNTSRRDGERSKKDKSLGSLCYS